MTAKFVKATALVAIAAFTSLSAVAQDAAVPVEPVGPTPQEVAAENLDQLLDLVEEGRSRAGADNKAREQRFSKDKANQAAELKRAEDERARQERRSARLEKQFEEEKKASEEERAAERKEFEDAKQRLRDQVDNLEKTSQDLEKQLAKLKESAGNSAELESLLAQKDGWSLFE